MVFLAKFQADEGDYFQYRKAAKFTCELLIALSTIVVVASIGAIISFGVDLKSWDWNAGERLQRDYTFALFIYTIVVLLVSICDVISAALLHFGIRKLKLSYCLFWRGATATSLIVLGMLTLAFATMVMDLTLILGYLPSLVSKPFSLWIVNGFMRELDEMRAYPLDPAKDLPASRPSFSLDDLETLKRSTTVFQLNKKPARRYSQTPHVVTSKLKSIPESE